MESVLFAPGDFELVRSLSISVRKRASGFASGEQRSPSRGGGIEFADYREYMPGDDARMVDWSVYLRLGKLIVKLCAEEKELTVVTILDASRSMATGVPEKLFAAKRIACALSCVSLNGGNRAGICEIADGLNERLRPDRGRSSIASAIRALSDIEASDAFSPAKAIKEFASRYSRRCVAILISDFLYPEWQATLTGLAATDCEPYAIQILSPEEIDPQYRGEISLVDAEGNGELPFLIDERTRANYKRELKKHIDSIGAHCGSLGLGYSLVPSDTPLYKTLGGELKKGGLLC